MKICSLIITELKTLSSGAPRPPQSSPKQSLQPLPPTGTNIAPPQAMHAQQQGSAFMPPQQGHPQSQHPMPPHYAMNQQNYIHPQHIQPHHQIPPYAPPKMQQQHMPMASMQMPMGGMNAHHPGSGQPIPQMNHMSMPGGPHDPSSMYQQMGGPRR